MQKNFIKGGLKMKKIINRKNAAAVACAAMMICAAGAMPDSVKCEYARAGG